MLKMKKSISPQDLVPAIEEAIKIGREAEIPVQIAHIKALGSANWGRSC